eukprot:TRINITY_DN21831_c0_g1_i1.p1 TRINITY_DN21831_c0_g1~~TRINITY_DN21831_c0_g1_i1.p1  ORF type:complete len:281 (+),score=26.65 TRINITY_DN21831_c0_g1_i1:135-977(+)
MSVWTSLVAGAATGAVECFVTYPTEYVKTHLQLGGGKYKGMVDCTMQTVRMHGVFGLYKGMSVLLAGSIPKQAVRWGAFEQVSGVMRDEKGALNTQRRVVCGAVAGAVEGAFIVTPSETIKTAFIIDQRGRREYKSLLHGIKTIYSTHGLTGLYKGALPTMAKQATNQAVRFPAQFIALSAIAGSSPEKRSSPLYNGIAGVAAGIISVIVTQPIDLVKTRMQGPQASHYQSTLHCFATVVSTEGARVLYSGTIPRMVRVGANVGLTFTIFPLMKRLINSF